MLLKRIAISVVLLSAACSVVACVPNFLSGQPGASSGSSANNPATTSSTTPSVTPVVTVVHINEPMPAPPQDPILGKRRGTRSSHVDDASTAITNNLNIDVEQTESDLLTNQQSACLLKIFRNNDGVQRIIDDNGGDSSDATYWVKQVTADEDDAYDGGPWVTATLRADFPASEGKRAVEMQVYRRKIDDDTLSNTVYVMSTQVGYVDATGALANPKNIHFKN
jgi:hypothetical protein